jgi:hypothetical protein
MKLSKKGQAGISTQVTGIIVGIVLIVILISMAPELWTVLNNALTNENLTDIPFLGSLTGLIGLIFGVVIFLGAIYAMFKLMSKKR